MKDQFWVLCAGLCLSHASAFADFPPMISTIDELPFAQAPAGPASLYKFVDVSKSPHGEESAVVWKGPDIDSSLMIRTPGGEWKARLRIPGGSNASGVWRALYDSSGNLYVLGVRPTPGTTNTEAFLDRYKPGSDQAETEITLPDQPDSSTVYMTLAKSAKYPYAIIERTAGGSASTSDECWLYGSRDRGKSFSKISVIPGCNGCFGLAASPDGKSLGMICSSKKGASPSSVVLTSGDSGVSWDRSPVPGDGPRVGDNNGRKCAFDDHGNWYSIFDAVSGQANGIYFHKGYLIKRDKKTHELTSEDLPMGGAASLYCKGLAIVHETIYLSCSATWSSTDDRAIVLYRKGSSSQFKTLYEYRGRDGLASASLALDADESHVYSGIEERWSDRSLVQWGASLSP